MNFQEFQLEMHPYSPMYILVIDTEQKAWLTCYYWEILQLLPIPYLGQHRFVMIAFLPEATSVCCHNCLLPNLLAPLVNIKLKPRVDWTFLKLMCATLYCPHNSPIKFASFAELTWKGGGFGSLLCFCRIPTLVRFYHRLCLAVSINTFNC